MIPSEDNIRAFVLLILRAYVCAYAYALVKTYLKTALSFHLQVQKINNSKYVIKTIS